jgi:hypothetical protein
MLTAGVFRSRAGTGKLHREALPFLVHCEHGSCRSHFNFAWRQLVQLSWTRTLFGCVCVGVLKEGVALEDIISFPPGSMSIDGAILLNSRNSKS